ncbi:amino acid transport protein [Acinetobacter cumulans]|uniref:Amino acid transport protein n=1 Tax=Acinetobacter cumulans TaxID=2136182 RepID=A0A498DFI8_9GAMM|nr:MULTISPECIES: amino acid transport protein [Acinetobacter]NWK74725.1 amino acid transport protein [Acinetobacter sp. SwsAc6]QCO21454.1 amino acid transport protein [Acinetobacter cumulans]RFS29649.1 amino acid transport protein [Acinetobacter sp. SWAC5]RKG42899.1 amino acid transport protein [Acinetobacter cumulans]RKG49180.1 amino acid transport protein [Acinetobacter cumulans]
MNATILLLGVLFSSIGFGYFLYGKKQQKSVPLICGIALIIYPYFIENISIMLALGLILCVIPKFIRL